MARRVFIDCREQPNSQCSLFIAGSEQEVLEAAVAHVKTKHGMSDSPETREKIRSGLKDDVVGSLGL